MRIRDLTPDQVPSGTRIRVTHIAPGEAELLGYVHDAEMVGQAGTVERLTSGPLCQLYVEWDSPRSIMLTAEDEIEVLR
jgi:hypothetical protein